MKLSPRILAYGFAGMLCLAVAASAAAKTLTVRVGASGDSFSPAAITIETGDEIEWRWDSSFHSSTSGTPDNPSGMWNSGVLNSGSKFTQEFFTVGDFSYYCSVHGGCCMMTGTVHVVAESSTPTPTPRPTPTPTATPSPLLPLVQTGLVSVELQAVAGGLKAPNDLVPSGDGGLFIVEQTGRIRLLRNGVLKSVPFLDLSARLVPLSPGGDERGLLGLAFHPGFTDPTSPGFRKFYTYTSEPVAGPADFTVPISGAFNHQSVVAEWQVSASNPDVADPTTRREVLRVDEPQSNHNGGKLAFRPGEPYLYISLGDGGASNDVGNGHNNITGNGQDLTTVLGKILRIRPTLRRSLRRVPIRLARTGNIACRQVIHSLTAVRRNTKFSLTGSAIRSASPSTRRRIASSSATMGRMRWRKSMSWKPGKTMAGIARKAVFSSILTTARSCPIGRPIPL